LKAEDGNIFWIMDNNKNTLATKNENGYRICKPYQNKIAASIINGLEILPIIKKNKILFLEYPMGLSVTHVSDMIGNEGKCFMVLPPDTIDNKLSRIFQKHNNIITISNKFDEPEKFPLDTKVDVVYVDLIQLNYIEIALKNSRFHLKDCGYLIVIIETKKISVNLDGTYPSDNTLRDKIQKDFDIIQEINLTDFFKNYTLFISKKRIISSN
tara:strand:- start:53 stop:688 length:636 start_codon:yes stop_codon:yes gene_type:complete